MLLWNDTACLAVEKAKAHHELEVVQGFMKNRCTCVEQVCWVPAPVVVACLSVYLFGAMQFHLCLVAPTSETISACYCLSVCLHMCLDLLCCACCCVQSTPCLCATLIMRVQLSGTYVAPIPAPRQKGLRSVKTTLL